MESCIPAKFEELVRTIINSYFEQIEKREETEIPTQERFYKASCALAGFPLFVVFGLVALMPVSLQIPTFHSCIFCVS